MFASIEIVERMPWLRLSPPLIAIVVAIVSKDVNFSLILAVFAGCLLITDLDVVAGFDKTCDVLVNQIADPDHASVIIFTVLLGSMVGLMKDSGGTAAVVNRIATFADNRRKGQVLTWVLGLLVFFDDYANTMLIGGSMRPLCDRLRISRAKLAFLIDSTAAPVAGLLLSTWTAFEIDQVGAGLASVAEQGHDLSNVSSGRVFLNTIPYRIYPLLAILVVGAVAASGRDLNPMRAAEESPSPPEPDTKAAEADNAKGQMRFAIYPVLVLLSVVIGGLMIDGINVDSYRMLVIASICASAIAAIVPVLSRTMSIADCSRSWTNGIKSMIPAIVILTLAWAVSAVCQKDGLRTADYIISLLGNSLSPAFLPSVAFVTAGLVAVSIGSSFTTMGLMVPMFVPLAFNVIGDQASAAAVTENPIFLATVGAILAGAIFGDHCSPISDTTVLSSAAAGCEHLQHVATQLPYALMIAACSVLFGYLPIGFGIPWWIAVPLSGLACVLVVVFLGQVPRNTKTETE